MKTFANSSTNAIPVDTHSLDRVSRKRPYPLCVYIEERDGAGAARRVALRIHQGIGQLSIFPESGRVGRKPDTRELVLSGLPFIAIYRLRRDAVEIARILHGAQKWP